MACGGREAISPWQGYRFLAAAISVGRSRNLRRETLECFEEILRQATAGPFHVLDDGAMTGGGWGQVSCDRVIPGSCALEKFIESKLK
ncbi:protein of unknown function [Aminobacter niigataensis]|nr:protein of unknown function [Aminobacter niigataensis]